MNLRTLTLTVFAILVGVGGVGANGKQEESKGISVQTVSYNSGEDTVSAYLARPNGKGPFPAIIVIHEWWGLNDWIKQNAREFAEKGYVALAVDLYRGEVAEDQDLAHELSRGLPRDRAVRDMKAALAYLRSQAYVNQNKIGSIGWCMGGGYSLQLALSSDINACVIAYGRLVTDSEQVKKLEIPILGIFGETDRGIPPASVREFEKILNEQKISNEIHIYGDAGHAFMNPNNKRGYSEKAAKQAWKEIYDFLNTTLTKN